MSLTTIREIFLTQGKKQYGGEAVSQLEHALQCAYLAEKAEATPTMIMACLLHDLGHLIGKGDRHEENALDILGDLFGEEVTEPIRLHVKAKRYLCAVESDYWSSLSPASQQSLIRQGGVFSPTAAEEFYQLPYAADAIQLRRWDEEAKIPDLLTPDLDHFLSK